MSAITDSRLMSTAINLDYDRAEQQFIQLLETGDLDKQLNADSSIASEFEAAIALAIKQAYAEKIYTLKRATSLFVPDGVETL